MKPLVLCLLAATFLAPGCSATGQPMSDPDRRASSTATIKRVVKAELPYYTGPRSGPGLTAGPPSGRFPLEASLIGFRNFLDQNGIVIENIVREEVSAALRASGKLSLVDKPGPGVATINIDIKQYGLSIPHGLSSSLVPILLVACEIVDASGKVVWTSSHRTLTLGNPAEAVPVEEMRSNPKAAERSLRIAAKYVATNIAKDL
jgi:hypothetical protein